ncbi:Techylectin-5A like protein [Argiope bruennichi]|uniref:Techylectin-5A like protein n=1 Tax=Argiope bruennichi TaxID=94029 RepID=A0A8T0FGH4_ARGBR|nr:Techylectin-5A like protein [Argiope bruennichi]
MGRDHWNKVSRVLDEVNGATVWQMSLFDWYVGGESTCKAITTRFNSFDKRAGAHSSSHDIVTLFMESVKSDCSEKETALALLEKAENFLTKAGDSYPTCKNNLNSTDQYDSEKCLAYIKISKKLISDVREAFPSCSKPTADDDQHVVKEEKLSDCFEILASGRNKSGIYILWPREFPTERPLKAYCDMDTDGGGWTVIQRRGKFPFQQDFNKDWERYKNGFGKLTEEFWLGNENIRVLCLRGCKIRFDLQEEKGGRFFAVYEDFSLSSTNYRIDISGYSGNVSSKLTADEDKYVFKEEKYSDCSELQANGRNKSGNENIRVLCLRGCKIRFDLQEEKGGRFFAVYEDFSLSSTNYRLDISGYSGNATDAMKYLDQNEFSTKDKDITGKAKEYKSGWWHGVHCNLNGIYQPGKDGVENVYWFREDFEILSSVEIKVKPN